MYDVPVEIAQKRLHYCEESCMSVYHATPVNVSFCVVDPDFSIARPEQHDMKNGRNKSFVL